MATKTQIAQQIVNILNDSSKMTDPLGSDRVGSFCFMPHDDLSFNRMLPKLKIEFDDQDEPNLKGMGKTNLKLQKYQSFNIWIYVQDNQSYTVGSTKYKNEELIDLIEESIENAIVNNQGQIQTHFTSFGSILSPAKNDGSNLIVGVKPVMFRYRKQF